MLRSQCCAFTILINMSFKTSAERVMLTYLCQTTPSQRIVLLHHCWLVRHMHFLPCQLCCAGEGDFQMEIETVALLKLLRMQPVFSNWDYAVWISVSVPITEKQVYFVGI